MNALTPHALLQQATGAPLDADPEETAEWQGVPDNALFSVSEGVLCPISVGHFRQARSILSLIKGGE